MPSSRAVSTIARTESLPRRWPSLRLNPRRWAQRPLPSITIATCRGRRDGSSDRFGKSSKGNEIPTERDPKISGRRADAPLKSDLHYFRLFGGQNLVDPLDKFRGELLHLGLGRAQVVVGNFLFLVEVLEHVVGVAAMVADRDAEVFGHLLDVLDQFFAALLGQLGNRNANDLPVVLRRQAEVGALNRLLDLVQCAFVVGRDD